MAVPYAGRGAYLGFGALESSYGTPATRTKFLPLISSSLSENAMPEIVGHLRGDDDGYQQTAEYVIPRSEVTGQLVTTLGYEGSGYLLALCVGAAASSSGAGPYTHTYAPTASEPGSMGLEVMPGTRANSVLCGGFKVQEWSIECAADGDGVARLTFSGLGGAASTTPSPTAYSAPTRELVQSRHAGTLSVLSTTFALMSAKLTVKTGVAELYEMGSIYTSEPVRSTLGEVRLECRVAYRADTIRTGAIAGTSSALSLAFTSGSKSLTIASGNARIVKASDPYQATTHGPMVQDVEFALLGSGSTNAYSIAIVNAQANYYD